MIPEPVADSIQPITGSIQHTRSIGGGCIAHATRVEAARGVFFLKWAEGEAARAFEAEVEGLRALRAAAIGHDLIIPEPLAAQNAGAEPGYLLLEWIEHGTAHPADWRRFGNALAALHHTKIPANEGAPYGYAVDNWIGSKLQRNGWMSSWPEFFGEKRLQAQAETVRKHGAWNAAWDASLNHLIERLGEILPAAPKSSLLHGDLWAGNALATADSRFALIDPAVYIGHREADLAMTELFGGFAPGFYEGYNEAWPLESGYPERRDIYQLFHLINHLTPGLGYAGQVERILQRFGDS